MAISKTARLVRGTQIAYIPSHAKGDINHPDVRFGFVTSGPTADNSYFCRYWMSRKEAELRTKANSECTPGHLLVEYPLFTGNVVAFALRDYCE